MTQAGSDMDVRDIIYKHHDPCVDGYYSFRSQHIVFGARRNTPTGLKINVITQTFSPIPSAVELGVALLAELMTSAVGISADSPLLAEIDSGRYTPVKMAIGLSNQQFHSCYWPFGIWTKDGDVPFIIGAPLSNQYPDSLNRRPVRKSSTAEQLGFAVKRFLEELSGHLQAREVAD